MGSLPEFEYLKPKTLDEALNMLSEYGDQAKILAGGTDLLVLMRDRALRPKYLIDIKGIPELHQINYSEQEGLNIGAAITLNQLLEMEIVKSKFRALWDGINSMSDQILRNRATLVGNICNASPAADSAPPLLIFDAKLQVVSVHGERIIPIQEFFKGPRQIALRSQELVKSVRIPTPPDSRSGYLKWGRVHGEDLAIVGVAALITNEDRRVRVALSSVAPTPLRINEVESISLKDGSLQEKIEQICSIVERKISPISDIRASKEYRLYMAKVLTRRLLRSLLEMQ